MAVSSGRYGKPKKFLTRLEHLEFRGITKLLEMTAGYLSRAPNERNRIEFQSDSNSIRNLRII